jgi:hypothetical protein
MITSDASALVFALNKEMTAEDIFKEFNQKVRTCTLPNKLIMQAMICALPIVEHSRYGSLSLSDHFGFCQGCCGM